MSEKIGRKISSRDFSHILVEMVQGDELYKEETGGRGTKVYYSLTEYSKKKYQLKILSEGEKYEKRRQIYYLLLYYDLYKRDNLITKNHLNKLLRKAGVSFDDLGIATKDDEKYIQKINVGLNDYGNGKSRLLGCLKGIAIGEHFENMGITIAKNSPRYYVVIPGFTVDEFISYLNKLKRNQTPKPFTNNIPLVPYVRYTDYTKDEIIESIGLLHQAGLIGIVFPPIFNEETRYIVSDRRLFRLFFMLKKIHIYEFESIISKILHIEKPSNEDKDWLTYFFGEQHTDLLIAKAYELRKNFHKDKQNQIKIEEIKSGIKKINKQKDALVDNTKESYIDVLQSNILLQDLFE